MELKEGTEIYYNGDMANDPGFGKIVKVTKSGWNTFYSIEMEDGRVKNIPSWLFSNEYLGHGGTRFVTKAAYQDWRNKTLKNYQKVN